MACPDCERRRKMLRDAVLHGKMADALEITVEGLRAMIGIDAASDHRKEATGLVVGEASPEVPEVWTEAHKLTEAKPRPRRRKEK